MEVKRWELMPHVYLTYLPARKFKTGVLSAQFITPLAKETASYNALLPAVLHRGTMRCPDMEQLAAAMDRLYGAQISPTIRKRGETQCLGFVASFIDDRFVSRNEPLLEPAAELLGELLLDPVTRGGRFLQEYVEGEKANLADAIRSIRNDKRDWADLRLLQEMCAGEPYGISRFGDEAGLAKINNQKLYAHSQRMMSSSRLELFYCGSAECHRVEEALLTAFSSLTRGPQTEPEPPRRFAAPSQPRLVTEEMDVTQGKLSMGFRCDTDDRAEAEILRQLDEIRQGLWEDWELTAARESLLSALQALGDSQGALENYYLGLAATGRRETPEEMAALLRQVTPECIRAAAQSVQLDTIYFLKGKEA